MSILIITIIYVAHISACIFYLITFIDYENQGELTWIEYKELSIS